MRTATHVCRGPTIAAHGQTMVQDDSPHCTNGEQKVQHDPADRFDHEYYRGQQMTSLIELFGYETISRIETRKGPTSPNGPHPPLHVCTANVYIADPQAFTAVASRKHPRVLDAIARFTSVGPVPSLTEVVGALDSSSP